ncbi:MFS transporter [Planosporangium flavigriseum]|uniref:MFS transporter n=1 Tax=Planosporangium flavigriseum TaxID=373681 RepID=A0A8J3M3W8_9ACTN|nr:MFS transporter [Planosporangium flavigriseum]NJC67903.1 MFS transporter [Planosporangium flavigriseum]GIG76440.1 MFS transporter [Planosporangium flavigriseum]
MPLAIYALAAAGFAIGTTEFVVVGLLPKISASLHVAVSTAGLLVTGYAVGVALGGILLTLATRRVPPRRLLIATMSVFALGHLVMAVSPNFAVLLVARFVTASCHGAFFGVGAVVAAELMGPERRAQGISFMFGGLTVATVVGVPAGTLLGQVAGWRAPFLAIAVVAAGAAVAVSFLVPASDAAAGQEASTGIPRSSRPALVAALVTTVIGWGSQFVIFSFLSEYLLRVTHFSIGGVTAMLLVFGIASAIGNALGGPFADRMPRLALPITFGTLAIVLTAFAALGHHRIPTAVTVFIWGIAGFALIPACQSRVMAAGQGSVLASMFNIAAFNVGIASASALGALLVDHGHLGALPLVASALAAIAIPVSLGWLPAPAQAVPAGATTARAGGVG